MRTDKNEAKKWLLQHNFQEAFRVAVADLVNNENYEPFLGLAAKDMITVGMRRDAINNIHFFVVESFEEAYKLTIEPPFSPMEEEPPTESEVIQPRRKTKKST